MSSPFGHHHSHHGGDDHPPPPPVHHQPTTFGGAHHNPPPPAPPQVVTVQHSGHHNSPVPPPPQPTGIHVASHSHSENNHLGELANKPTFKIYCKAGGDHYSVAIRHGKVILTNSDPSDPTQHWIKDEKYSTRVKDAEGYPSFSLVNKSTGQVLKHTIAGQPVQLIQYNTNASLDESTLWTQSQDLGSGFRTIRMVNNVKLVMDAFHGDKDHGGVHDGTLVALYESWKGDNQNQQWKLYPHSHCKLLYI